MKVLIREYQDTDSAEMRTCMVELQDFERTIDSRLLPGETIADGYCARIHQRCREADGCVFVATVDGAVVGFVVVLAREPFTELDEPPGTYALVSDLVVLAAFRRQGIARRLLERAEDFARNRGATELRIGVLQQNTTARRLYLEVAFQPLVEIFAKRL